MEVIEDPSKICRRCSLRLDLVCSDKILFFLNDKIFNLITAMAKYGRLTQILVK